MLDLVIKASFLTSGFILFGIFPVLMMKTAMRAVPTQQTRQIKKNLPGKFVCLIC